MQLKSLRLQQTNFAGSIFITESLNIIITVMAATAVINNHITLGTMLAIQFIIGQLISPVEQLTQWAYSLQDVKISLERINEIRQIHGEDTPASTGQRKVSLSSTSPSATTRTLPLPHFPTST